MGQVKANSQITVPADLREDLDIQEGDTLWLDVIKVIDRRGDRKYPRESRTR